MTVTRPGECRLLVQFERAIRLESALDHDLVKAHGFFSFIFRLIPFYHCPVDFRREQAGTAGSFGHAESSPSPGFNDPPAVEDAGDQGVPGTRGCGFMKSAGV